MSTAAVITAKFADRFPLPAPPRMATLIFPDSAMLRVTNRSRPRLHPFDEDHGYHNEDEPLHEVAVLICDL